MKVQSAVDVAADYPAAEPPQPGEERRTYFCPSVSGLHEGVCVPGCQRGGGVTPSSLSVVACVHARSKIIKHTLIPQDRPPLPFSGLLRLLQLLAAVSCRRLLHLPSPAERSSCECVCRLTKRERELRASCSSRNLSCSGSRRRTLLRHIAVIFFLLLLLVAAMHFSG